MDNPPGGPGKGPETPDKPTPPRTGDKPPADASGPSGTPRIDSYVAAGQPVPGRPETGTERRGDREAQPNGSSTDSSSTDPVGEKQKTPGGPPTEAESKTAKEPETGKTEVGSQSGEEREPDKADPAQTGNGGTEAERPAQAKIEDPQQDEGERDGDRGSATDQPKPGEAARPDDRDEETRSQDNGSTGDDSATAEQQSTVPAETTQYPPGSRLESIARTRAGQEAGAEQLRAIFQDTQATNAAGEGTAGGSGDRSAPPQSENAGTGKPEHGAQPPGTETPPGTIGDNSSGGDGSGDGEGSGSRDQPAPAPPEAEAKPPAHEIPRPQDQEHEPLVPQDSSGPGDDSGDPPTKPPVDGSPPADDQTRDGKDGTPPGPEVAQPTEPAAETGPAVPEPGREASSVGPETTDQGTEPPEPMADGDTTGNETDNPKPADETTPPPEGTGENVTPPEALGEQSDDHGRNAESDGTESDPEATDESKPEVRPNSILSDVYTDSQGRVHVEPRYGREQTDETGSDPLRNEAETTEPAGLPTREDLDPVGAGGGEPGRGELHDPEDDRASRDYQEGKPDKLSRARGELKKFLNDSQNAQDSVKTFAEPTLKNFEKVKPTGQHSRVSPNGDRMKAPDQTINSGDAFIGFIGTAIVLTEIVRFGIKLSRQRRENANHR